MNRWWPSIALVALIGGCSSSTPDCADDATLEVLDFEIFEEVDGYVKQGSIEGFAEIAETYAIDQIRTLSYDKSVDSYRCSANVTYEFRGRVRSIDFNYRVDIDQSTGETLVEYERKMLNPITGYLMGF